jgi:hypothetical protein
LKMKRKDNFNDIENVFCETTNLFPWKKCPCWQEISVTIYHTARELTLVAKWNALRNTLVLQCL